MLLSGGSHMPSWAQAVEGLKDLGQLMPVDIKVTSGGPQQGTVFLKSEVWAQVARWMKRTPEGIKFFNSLNSEQQQYLISLWS